MERVGKFVGGVGPLNVNDRRIPEEWTPVLSFDTGGGRGGELAEFKTHARLPSSGFCRRVYASLASARTTKTTDEEQD